MPPTQLEAESTTPPIFVPPNDEVDECQSNNVCECAYRITQEDVGKSLWGSTANAVQDPVNTCGDISTNGAGVWYKISKQGFVVSGDNITVSSTDTFQRRLVASLCEQTTDGDGDATISEEPAMGTDYDTQISIFAGDRCDRLRCVAGNDQGGIGCADLSRASFLISDDSDNSGTASDTEYYLYVHGFRSSRGNFLLSLSDLPNNMDCPNAMELEEKVEIFSSTRGSSIVPGEIG
eukprot:CAMPEP_0119555868 /NCGR_PEP_ID=MMETSP1352-20130426/7963_1 /TAXON_ID=265584 /ORGANISM="Stauroneis constricta, Strain CCMP1120" /LENGTH=234 /DNA_ID=CAMNT_0007602721 /DNA_START=44 /DNA_END=744 /DNA_ORIENTATION=+